MPFAPAIRRLRQKDCEFKARLGYLQDPDSKNKEKSKRKRGGNKKRNEQRTEASLLVCRTSLPSRATTSADTMVMDRDSGPCLT
jgi:hypothetical protein